MPLPVSPLVNDGSGIPRAMGAGDGFMAALIDQSLTTVGAGTLLAALFSTGIILRTGPTAAFIDTLDTAANFNAQFPNLDIGESIQVIYSVNVAFAGTIAVGTGITLKTVAANNVVPASSSRWIVLEKTSATTYDAYVL